MLKLPAGSNSDHEVIQWILIIEQMLEYLVDGFPVHLARLDRHPLAKKDCNSSPEDVVPRFLNLNFRDEGGLQEIDKIEVFL